MIDEYIGRTHACKRCDHKNGEFWREKKAMKTKSEERQSLSGCGVFRFEEETLNLLM